MISAGCIGRLGEAVQVFLKRSRSPFPIDNNYNHANLWAHSIAERQETLSIENLDKIFPKQNPTP